MTTKPRDPDCNSPYLEVPGFENICCCNCAFQIELFKHPWNQHDLFKGSISESTKLYACIGLGHGDGKKQAIIFEKKHSVCEMHTEIMINN